MSYGAVLQAYALKMIIQNSGFKCDVINYGKIGSERFLITKNARFIFKYVIANILSIPREDKRRKKFRKFRQDFIGMNTKYYSSSRQLSKLNEEYDFFIAGSDQIWNPFLNKCDFAYLLDFVALNDKKIAYAPSFGVSELPSTLLPDYHKWLSKIKKLSIRESEGQHIIGKLQLSDAKIVLDPTLLVSPIDWLKITIEPKFNKKYILCFTLTNDRPKVIDKILVELNLKEMYEIINIGGVGYSGPKNERTLYSSGPQELLGLIKNAEIVITTSYHGTIFSILFRKKFITIMSSNANNVNSRLKELSKKFDLHNNVIFDYDITTALGLNISNINYESIFNKLYDEISYSMFFLQTSLEEGTNNN